MLTSFTGSENKGVGDFDQEIVTGNCLVQLRGVIAEIKVAFRSISGSALRPYQEKR